jgi:hypothetical protein
MRKCEICQIEIPESRLETLPHTTTCVKHSTEQAYVGVMSYPHKTGGFLCKMRPENEEGLRQMLRGYNRKR